ncbi:hypothetical protein SCHPADRAFT_997349 [Schizopora paradoxa]|uniref:Uncharacterized protein n=1 Tax=Schizopora paradoxa TaxID=27342 RepID=A0A0H2RVM5_9AGAM|nr:hypothetical protein SCHPADRAFT_997349 [Schizopora paradoxa]
MPPGSRSDLIPTKKSSLGWRRPIVPIGRREISIRNIQATQRAVRKELSSKKSEIALRLITCNEELQRTYGRIRASIPKPTATQAEFMNDWRRLTNKYDQAVSQTRLFAVDGASTIADFLTSVLPYLLDPENSVEDRSAQVEAYLRLLLSAGAREDVLKPKLSEVIDEMDRFQERWSTNTDFSALLEPSNIARGNVRSLLATTQPDGRMNTFFDNSTLPGFMTAMSGLLSKDLVGRMSGLLDGENRSRIEDLEHLSIDPNAQRPSNTFDCFMDVRNILRMDLEASAKRIQEGRMDASSVNLEGRDKIVMVFYKDMETALKDFASLLSNGAQGDIPQLNVPDGANRSKIAQFFRRFWSKK